MLKCTKFDFRWGSAPDPARGAYSPPQTPYVFKGPTSKRREEERGKGRGREREGRRGKRGEGWPPNLGVWIRQ